MRRGQISLDLIFSIFLLTIVSTYVAFTLFSLNDTQYLSYISDRAYDIMDDLENLMLTCYSKDISATYILRPIGDLSYRFHIKNKEVLVNKEIFLSITPTEDGVIVNIDNSTLTNDIGNRIVITINISGKTYNFTKNLALQVN
ncbi:Protein of unknown function DUF361 [Methanocaldococcus infernus ME]|uniref:Flagellin n=1 Tax=Methanocaldococcus infernus (strain DSM 11812 / JCM 15783 / ME) TaxID=573063 RepID=D5VTA2_METIM|nr:hypothetical protein [Methanocaldococcus infernus]ADG13805.1 Protein of unknown function DUF361 [Methanocaldococcus infernus ME]